MQRKLKIDNVRPKIHTCLTLKKVDYKKQLNLRKKIKTRKGFSDEKRMLIIQAYFDGASKNLLCRTYNLASSRTISNWLRIFGIEDTRTTYIPTAMNKTVKQPVNESEELKQLRQELKQTMVVP